MDTIGVIPARYASNRFAGKVLADIDGKPLIRYVWERARLARSLDDLIVACDDEQVVSVARGFGARAVMTSPDHSCGTDRIAEVVNPLDVRVVVNIQADEPLIHPSMIDAVAGALLADRSVSMATLKKRIDDPATAADPNCVKVVTDSRGRALYFSRSPIPYRASHSKEEGTVQYKHIGLYAYTKDFLFQFRQLAPSLLERTECLEQLRVLENGYAITVIETVHDTVGVDTPEDLERVKPLIRRGI
jgi:3-deoxy-manno-octulosonate cytidylyltransferase (CMP-KDO synthetase)